jgi:hypothetical protein
VPILPRFRAHLERIEDMQKIARILLEVGEFPDSNGARPKRMSADGHNTDRRRGLPLIARGVGGTSPKTDPMGELLRREARGELRL